MYFIALATDYDGTLAHDGIVSRKTLGALERFKKSGRKLVFVTGRELPDLKGVFPDIGLFDKVVAENGALIYTPASEDERVISPPPEPKFVARLKKQGVKPLSVGRAIVATWEPHQATVLEVIKKLGLELEIIFNKGAVMILPSGINKATGLAAALQDLRLSPHNVVGVGDAENDHAFLQACGCSVAVDNAIPAVKNTADLITRGARGKGVEELIDRLIKRDHEIVPKHHDGIVLGSVGGNEVYLSPTDTVLIAGSSGIGKSTLATALTERFVESRFQFCVFDPEGDYDGLEGAVRLGDGSSAPTKAQVLDLIAKADSNIVINGLSGRSALPDRCATPAACLDIRRFPDRIGIPNRARKHDPLRLASWAAPAADIVKILLLFLAWTVRAHRSDLGLCKPFRMPFQMVAHECRNEEVRMIVAVLHAQCQRNAGLGAGRFQKPWPQSIVEKPVRRALVDEKLGETAPILDKRGGVIAPP